MASRGAVWLIALFSLGASLAGAEGLYMGAPREDILRIVDLGYNLDSRVPELIEAMIRDYPESPMGLCLKAARLFRLNDYAEGSDPSLVEAFERASSEAIEAAAAYYQGRPEDPEARYALAMCELNFARFQIDRRHWLSGFFKATSGIRHLKEILKSYPDFHDAKMPLGVANCFLDDAPVYLKPIAALLRFPANREVGLQQLRDAEEKGFLTRYESLYYQTAVHWVLFKDREEAMRTLGRFLERFPRNVNAHVMMAQLERQIEDYEAAFARCEQVLTMPESSYLGEVVNWVVLYSGTSALHLGKKDLALEIGIRLLDTVGEDQKRLRAWATTLKGNALVHLGKREEGRAALLEVDRSDNPEAYRAARQIIEEMEDDSQ